MQIDFAHCYVLPGDLNELKMMLPTSAGATPDTAVPEIEVKLDMDHVFGGALQASDSFGKPETRPRKLSQERRKQSSSSALEKLQGSADRVKGPLEPRLDNQYLKGVDSIISTIESLSKK